MEDNLEKEVRQEIEEMVKEMENVSTNKEQQRLKKNIVNDPLILKEQSDNKSGFKKDKKNLNSNKNVKGTEGNFKNQNEFEKRLKTLRTQLRIAEESKDFKAFSKLKPLVTKYEEAVLEMEVGLKSPSDFNKKDFPETELNFITSKKENHKNNKEAHKNLFDVELELKTDKEKIEFYKEESEKSRKKGDFKRAKKYLLLALEIKNKNKPLVQKEIKEKGEKGLTNKINKTERDKPSKFSGNDNDKTINENYHVDGIDDKGRKEKKNNIKNKNNLADNEEAKIKILKQKISNQIECFENLQKQEGSSSLLSLYKKLTDDSHRSLKILENLNEQICPKYTQKVCKLRTNSNKNNENGKIKKEDEIEVYLDFCKIKKSPFYLVPPTKVFLKITLYGKEVGSKRKTKTNETKFTKTDRIKFEMIIKMPLEGINIKLPSSKIKFSLIGKSIFKQHKIGTSILNLNSLQKKELQKTIILKNKQKETTGLLSLKINISSPVKTPKQNFTEMVYIKVKTPHIEKNQNKTESRLSVPKTDETKPKEISVETKQKGVSKPTKKTKPNLKHILKISKSDLPEKLRLDPLNPSNCLSYDVLTYLLDKYNAQVQKYISKGENPPSELKEKRKTVFSLHAQLETSVANEQIDMETYLDNLKVSIGQFNSLAVILNTKGKKEEAKEIINRLQIMEKELEGALQN